MNIKPGSYKFLFKKLNKKLSAFIIKVKYVLKSHVVYRMKGIERYCFFHLQFVNFKIKEFIFK